jgi:hypothetical protein
MHIYFVHRSTRTTVWHLPLVCQWKVEVDQDGHLLFVMPSHGNKSLLPPLGCYWFLLYQPEQAPSASGELGLELVENMDRFVSGFIGNFERSYSKLERAIKSSIGLRPRSARASTAPAYHTYFARSALRAGARRGTRSSTSLRCAGHMQHTEKCSSSRCGRA